MNKGELVYMDVEKDGFQCHSMAEIREVRGDSLYCFVLTINQNDPRRHYVTLNHGEYTPC